VKGQILELKNTIQHHGGPNSTAFAGEVTRVNAPKSRHRGKLGGQAQVPGVAGTWKDLTDNVNFMPVNPYRSRCVTSRKSQPPLRTGDLSKKKFTVDVRWRNPAAQGNAEHDWSKQLRSFAPK